MKNLSGKTAVISGGASGIGLNLAKVLGRAGINIVITDIEKEQLSVAERELAEAGIPVLAVDMDVSVKSDWERTAEATCERFGKVHMLVNNAGVGGGVGAIETLDEAGWQWTIDVNLMGVVYGAHIFVPLMKQNGEQGWLINLASIAGMAGAPFGGAYTATKAAVVALSEAWYAELQGQSIHVSVLAPAFVRTRIHESHRNRQPRYASDKPITPDVLKVANIMTQAVENGIDVDIVGQRVLEALARGEFYIFTHPNYRPVTDYRSRAVAEGFESASRSPLLQDSKDQDIVSFSG
jgi:NAD(P)-dependent dehydrogenase (short-subunit alcohol dehydrogenase family)